jgi:hypothetical protein
LVHAGADGTVILSGLDGMRFIWSMTRPNRGRSFFGPKAEGSSRIALAVEERGWSWPAAA